MYIIGLLYILRQFNEMIHYKDSSNVSVNDNCEAAQIFLQLWRKGIRPDRRERNWQSGQ